MSKRDFRIRLDGSRSYPTQNDIKLMAQIAKDKDLGALSRLFSSPNWQTFVAIAEEQGEASVCAAVHMVS